MNNIIALEFHGTLFAKLQDIYPECNFLIKDSTQLHPLICLTSSCHRNANCMTKLVQRIKFLFDNFQNCELILLYFSYRDKPGSQRAGVFWKDFREPRYITMNRSAWEKIKKEAILYQITLPTDLFLGGTEKMLPLL